MYFSCAQCKHFDNTQCKQKGHACRQAGFAPVQILVGVLILIVAVSGAYYFGKSQTSKPQLSSPPIISQTPQPTTAPQVAPKDKTTNPDSIGADWKIYNQDSYSIKYPSSWHVVADEGGRYITDQGNKIRLKLVGGPKIANKTIKESLHNYLEKQTSYGQQNLEYILEKEVNIEGAKGWYAHIKIGALNTEDVIVFIEDKNSSYIYAGLWMINYSDGYEEVFNKILSTFKFLPASPTGGDQESAEGKFCGGIAGIQCPKGYKCQLDGNYPDAGGKCVKL